MVPQERHPFTLIEDISAPYAQNNTNAMWAALVKPGAHNNCLMGHLAKTTSVPCIKPHQSR